MGTYDEKHGRWNYSGKEADEHIEATYKSMQAFDRDIADHWRTAARSYKPHRAQVGDHAMLTRILLPLFGKGTDRLTVKQAQALTLAYTDGADFEAQASILEAFRAADQLQYTLKGADPATKEQLNEALSALGIGVTGMISFYSPGSVRAYDYSLYARVADLLRDGSIRLFTAVAPTKYPTLAEYFSAQNTMLYYTGQDPYLRKVTFVHEVTHAIQDWTDTASSVRSSETDAFIAMMAAAEQIGYVSLFDMLGGYGTSAAELLRTVAKAVLAGQAGKADQNWPAKYELVAKLIPDLNSKYTSQQTAYDWIIKRDPEFNVSVESDEMDDERSVFWSTGGLTFDRLQRNRADRFFKRLFALLNHSSASVSDAVQSLKISARLLR